LPKTTTVTVSKLGESSTEIGQVIKVIIFDCEQTNCWRSMPRLKPRAPARLGKGFAVVANE